MNVLNFAKIVLKLIIRELHINQSLSIIYWSQNTVWKTYNIYDYAISYFRDNNY